MWPDNQEKNGNNKIVLNGELFAVFGDDSIAFCPKSRRDRIAVGRDLRPVCVNVFVC